MLPPADVLKYSAVGAPELVFASGLDFIYFLLQLLDGAQCTTTLCPCFDCSFFYYYLIFIVMPSLLSYCIVFVVGLFVTQLLLLLQQ